ncbi:haloacid dehalogenase type II [Paraglaciecola chathamensis]|uniref:(S)-2-haloacid dehalogenase n=2 Tax=Paraglaciecola chathamensis TaxID=368405 RepID=A0ABS0WEJ6_9ALTE|nr:haloacid dehalogenase type II [Paraglaciecola chathamensis]MBJ2136891.1 haloacid dehalogenase type II [Paraglaciecola chathamensis]
MHLAKRTRLLSLTFLFFSLLGANFMAQAAPKPKVIIFDVNETLLDLETMRTSIGEALDGQEEPTTLWFSTMLHHSLVTTVTGDYQDFGKIGVAALMMVAQNNDIKITEEQAVTAIKTPLLSLPAHPDVKAGLKALKEQGFKLVSLTNSSNKGVETQFKNAGLTDYFDKRMSIEDIKVYKPDLRAYAWALEQLNIKPEEALMVAAHGWDVAGAKAAGLQTAFVARPGKALYPLAQKPDYVVKDLSELVETLK